MLVIFIIHVTLYCIWETITKLLTRDQGYELITKEAF